MAVVSSNRMESVCGDLCDFWCRGVACFSSRRFVVRYDISFRYIFGALQFVFGVPLKSLLKGVVEEVLHPSF